MKTGSKPRGAPFVLLTFGPMIDSELSRLVLDHYGIAFVEERHLFGWASVHTLVRGRSATIPMLLGTDRGRRLRLAGPRAMVEHFDVRFPEARRLLPPREPLRRQVEADWRRFNGELATYTAALAYHHLLPHREIMLEVFARGVAGREAAMVGWAYAPLRSLITLLLRLSDGKARDCLALIRVVFAQVDARLATGRTQLAGDTVTLSELSLAAAAAPLLLPHGYRSPVPRFDQMPPVLQDIVAELREHATARFIARFYETRQRPGAAGDAPKQAATS
jgi:glutathione S-transferase